MLNSTKSRLAGKKFFVTCFILSTVFFTYTVVAQEFVSPKEGYVVSIPEKIQKLVLDPLPAGTYTIGSGGNFPTIDSAFNKLSIDGIAGNVTLELIDELYTSPVWQYGFLLNGPIPGAGSNSRVTIKPVENKNVTIEGNGEGVLYLLKTSYLTIDGVGISGPTTLTVHNLAITPYSYNDAITFIGNCDHNVVKNTTALTEDVTRPNSGVTFWPESNVIGTPDSNLIQNNFIKKATYGIYLGANQFQTNKSLGNIIRGNIIGSETDSLITFGIQTERIQNTIIEDNIIQNIRRQAVPSNDFCYGINTYAGYETVIRNNVVYDINSSSGCGTTGILLSGGSGSNNIVYNNMIYDIQSTSTQYDSRVTGIQIFNQTNSKIYYNSVFLSGTGANQLGSAAFYIYTGCTNVETKNNIFVNSRDESPYCASAIYDYTTANLTSDYNDLYYTPSQYNCLVRIGGTEYLNLADWQATGKDLNSISEMPDFIMPDLHIDFHVSTSLDGHATPIPGITDDIDGEARNVVTPDIGADEVDLSITFSQLTVNVIDGWNMVSIPGLNSPDQNVNTWWAYRDQLANVFKYANGYQSVTIATPRTGYWMKHTGALTYNTGEEWPSGGIQTVTHSPIPGNTGWNLIGGYELSVTAANVTTNPPGLQSGPIYKYSGGYQPATTIDPGYGYWIKLTGAGQIIIPETFAKGEMVEYFPEDWGRIILTDAAGINYTLYAVKGEVDLTQYELPPAPPAGMFDIRFGSGRIAEDLGSGVQIIEMKGITYPIYVRTKGLTITLQDETGKIVNDVLSSGEELTINNSLVNKLVILSAEVEKNIPTVYSLEQNYPNPFNPNTVISYQLIMNGDVSLKVFDILGNEIATLVDEYKPAGRYEVEFNASALPSGVYFYQLRAGNFSETKKMVLIR